MESKSCIRVLADVNQIRECKEAVIRIEDQVKTIAKTLNLAGNEVRLKILFLLHKETEMCPCDLSDVLNMKVPAISQHLRKMKDGGIITDKKVGQTIFYSIVESEAEILMPLIKSLKKMNEQVLVK